MFSGIVEEIGCVLWMDEHDDLVFWNGEKGKGYQLTIEAPLAAKDAYIGCSIGVNGVCLTVTKKSNSRLTFGIAPETLRRTNLMQLVSTDPVNIEQSIRADARNSGHFVQGHIDGTGEILRFTREKDSLWVRVKAPPEILQFILPKGYVAIDGTSLTVCQVNDVEGWFTVMLIQHTQNCVTLPRKRIGDHVNLEPDVMGKYAARQSASTRNRLRYVESQIVIAYRVAAAAISLSLGVVLALGYVARSSR